MGAEKSWGHFYAGSGSLEYYERHTQIHELFLNRILALSPKRVLEAGCGSGIMSVFFSKRGIQCVAADRDREVLNHAQKTNETLGGRVRFMEQDIFRSSFRDNEFDVVFSQGVLEHFSDEQIRKTIAEQLRLAPKVWASVPCKFYNHRDFGDERLLTELEWRKLLNGPWNVRTEYYYHQRMKKNFLLKRPLMLMFEVSRA